MSIRKVVAGLLITAGIAIMAVSFFWCTTGRGVLCGEGA